MPGWRCRRRPVYLICYERNGVYKVLLHMYLYALYTTLHPNIYTTPLYYICTMYRFITPQTHYYYACASRIYTHTVDLLFRKFAFCAHARAFPRGDALWLWLYYYVYCLMNGNKGITKVGTHCTSHTENKYHFRPYTK